MSLMLKRGEVSSIVDACSSECYRLKLNISLGVSGESQRVCEQGLLWNDDLYEGELLEGVGVKFVSPLTYEFSEL